MHTLADIQTPQYDSDSNRTLEVTAPHRDVGDRERTIINTCNGYKAEAEANRIGGLNPRDDKWRENLNLYWGRYDFSDKAKWQATERMPEVASFVDRFSGALKEALVSSPQGFYTVVDPADEEGDIAQAIKEMEDMWLSECGRNQTGTCLDFSTVFEEQCKLGALMACCSTVTWKGDTKYGRVAVETTDPRMVYLDHTYRNLYRIRQVEVDKHELKSMIGMKDKKGRPIYNLTEIDALTTYRAWRSQQEREEATGSGDQLMSTRQPILLDEYICTVVDSLGNIICDQSLIVIANGEYVIRGPEKNPFWHRKDWMVFAALVTAPLSVYGRSYMEDFGSVARTFNELTNLILDAVRTSALKAFAVVPSMLVNPAQLIDGVTPNKLFQLEEGYTAEQFIQEINLGSMSADAFNVWQAMKSELREASDINEIGMGQFAPKGRTSATEINQTQQSSSALIRSVAQTIETRYLDPILDLVWQTGLQHCSASDARLQSAVGAPMFAALMKNRKELVQRPLTFQARGLSQMITRSQKTQTLLGLFQVMNQSQPLMQAFMQTVDFSKVVQLLFQMSDIDLKKLAPTQRQQMISQITQPMQQIANAPGAAPNSAQQGVAQGAAQALGVAK